MNRMSDYVKIWLQPIPPEDKSQVIREISQSASSSFDFFLLVVLSCSIATLGLITNSPAVIIGAMLVAPLMSPIIGIGMASITGDEKLARNASMSLLFGAVLAVLLSAVMVLVNTRLPFVVLQELPSEVLARTHPTPIDLVIALAGGLAASYALTRPNMSAALPGVAIATALMPPLCTVGIGIALDRWDIAGGAFLLFITNAITIAFASALVMLARGFAPKTRFINHHVPRTLIISLILIVILLIPLSYYSVQFFQQANDNRQLNNVVQNEVKNMGAELVEFSSEKSNSGLNLIITVRTTRLLNYQQVVNLQKGIVGGLSQPVSLKVNQIFAERLDPLVPPTSTPTPTSTFTHTPGPSPTRTPSQQPPTSTLTPTLTPTITETPTATSTSTPTPAHIQVYISYLPQLQLYQSPGGPVIGQLYQGQELTLFYEKVELKGVIWVKVMDADGRVGWIPEIYVRQVSPTPVKR